MSQSDYDIPTQLRNLRRRLDVLEDRMRNRPRPRTLENPAYVGRVYNGGTPVGQNCYVLTHPCRPTGTESEGSPGAYYEDTSKTVPVLPIGSGVPGPGTIIRAKLVSNGRWVTDWYAEPGRWPIYLDVFQCTNDALPWSAVITDSMGRQVATLPDSTGKEWGLPQLADGTYSCVVSGPVPPADIRTNTYPRTLTLVYAYPNITINDPQGGFPSGPGSKSFDVTTIGALGLFEFGLNPRQELLMLLPPGATVQVVAGTFELPSGLFVTVTGMPGTWTADAGGSVTVDAPDLKFFAITVSRPGHADKTLILSTNNCNINFFGTIWP